MLVEPRFNDFTSMAPGPQRDEFMELARQDGVPVKDVLVADASKRTTTLNAYVSGFGSTRRLVVYDTLLKDATPAQVRLVVAHELGHAAEDDVLHGTLIGALGAAFAVVLLRLLLGARMADPRSTALLLALIVAGTTLASPVQNLVSRKIEARADYHSLRLTNDPTDFVEMQHQLSVHEHLRPRAEPLAVLDVRQPPDAARAHRDGPRLGDRARRAGPAAGPEVTVLVVTNDFPPRQGGIETFVRVAVRRAARAGRAHVAGCRATRSTTRPCPSRWCATVRRCSCRRRGSPGTQYG